jgi:hypothetical protein
MLWWIISILVILIIVSTSTSIEGFDPRQKRYGSFAERYEATDELYDKFDASQKELERAKEVGPNVSDAAHSWEYTRKTKEFDPFHYKVPGVAYDAEKWVPSSASAASAAQKTNNFCELMQLFLLRETSLANMMATQFTAEQKLQLQTFMNALNKYVSYIQTKKPSDASNLVRQVVANTKSSMLDVVMQYAQQTSDHDMESKKLVQTYAPIQVNPTMTAYISAMLLVGDMTTVRSASCD